MSALAPPDLFDRAGEALGERLNPIIVKEVRQGLRTRTFWIFFGLMLLSCLVISLVAFAANDGAGHESGQATFIAFFVCLAAVQFFVIPYTAYRSMSREREDETWVLLTLTGLGPRRILAGKIGSFVLQGLLYASAAAPFLLFSYYLNGIDLPTIVASVVVAGGYTLFLTSTAVSLATLAESRLVRGLLHFALLGLLFWGLFAGIAASVSVAEAMRSSSSHAYWVSAGAVLFGLVTTAVLLFELSAARLSLPTESYARGARLVFVLQVLGAAGFFFAAQALGGASEALGIGAVAICLYVAVVGTFVLADRDGMAPNHWAQARRFNLARPGALRAFVLQVLVMAVGFAATAGPGLASGKWDDDLTAVVLTVPALALFYSAAPQIVARWIPHPGGQTAMMVRILFVGLVVFGSGVPPLLGQIFFEHPDHLALNALNPVMALVNADKEKWDIVPYALLAWGAGLGCTAWAFFSLLGRDGAARG